MNWSKEFYYCRKCYKTESKHVMDGFCSKCFEDQEKAAKSHQKERQCLSCEQLFISEWEGNRRCEPCLRKEREPNCQTKSRYKINIKM